MKTKKLTLSKQTVANLNPTQLHSVNGGTGLVCNFQIKSAACIPPPKNTVWCSVVTCSAPQVSFDTTEGISRVINPSFENEFRVTQSGWRP